MAGFFKRLCLGSSLLVFAGLATPALAADKPAICLLSIDGVQYIRGKCTFSLRKGGSFKITSYDQKHAALVFVEREGVATGYWNEDPFTARVQAPLGTLYREDACWLNHRVSVCAW